MASTADPFIYMVAMESPQQGQFKRAMEEECISILLNDTVSAFSSHDAWQLQVQPIRSK